ncbi:MAG: SMI1/KNR4 family protein [Polyangiaceae bacterium]|nr:SMI1/KNR4 family protein [Polyangiaceae bacterium]
MVDSLKKSLRVPPRYRAFLLEANPREVETVCPIERVKLFGAAELTEEQRGFALDAAGEPRAEQPQDGWRRSWIIVGRSTLLGDPYFLDVAKPDAEGDCPVYTAMSGRDRWDATLCASSFAQFLRILATTMEIAVGYGDAILDDDDERAFREALAARVKPLDPAALRAGHWS